jgi:hypothetical protein
MLVLAPLGIWVGKTNGKKLSSIVSKVITALSILPWITNVLSWVRIPKYSNPTIEKQASVFRIISLIAWVVVVITAIYCVVQKIKLIKNKPPKQSPQDKVLLKESIETDEKASLNSSPICSDKIDLEVSKNCYPVKKSNQENESSNANNIESINRINSRSDIGNANGEKRTADSIRDYKIEKTSHRNKLSQLAHRICPECGGKLKSRQNHQTQEWFVGCDNYFTSIHCKYTIDYREFKEIESKFY